MLYGWTGQTIERGRDHCERPGPVGLEKFDTKTSRGPQHFAGPPRNETDITQIKKIRQCVISIFGEKIFCTSRREAGCKEKKKCKNPLAPGRSYDIFAPVWIPTSRISVFEQGLGGEGRESKSGGRDPWVSFY